MSRARAVAFTLNNPEQSDSDHLRDEYVNGRIEYCIYQFEVGTNGGTRHIQGYARAKSARTLEQWKSVIGRRAHIEFARGTPQQNIRYCTKDETREPGSDPIEHGDRPNQGGRTDLAAVAAAVTQTRSLQAVAEEFPADFIRYSSGIQRYFSITDTRKRLWKTAVFWFHGPTGTGKSLEAHTRFPDAYWKMGTNKWWDGYTGEDAVIIDDYRRDFSTFAELLRLFDRYPMRVEIKGGSVPFLAKTIVVTTSKDPYDTWEGRSDEEIQQLIRRIDEIKLFKRNDENVENIAPTFNLPN